jgi:NAD(P)H-flavin reductase
MSTEGANKVAEPIDSLTPRRYRVEHVQRELSDTVTLTVAPVDGARPAFAPGQFNMLYAFGVGEAAISISADGPGKGAFVHTVREVGAVSGAIARLGVGAMLGLRGPFGVGWPFLSAVGGDVVIVAGGLGLAPLRPVIHAILCDRNRYNRIAVLFGTRSPVELLYRHELESWRQRADVEVEVTVDHADAQWHGHVGVVPSLIARAGFDPQRTTAFVCGPEIMMRFTVGALRDAGVVAQRIYLSMERNMKCAIGLCGHCQFGSAFICKDGPVMRSDAVADIFSVREV